MINTDVPQKASAGDYPPRFLFYCTWVSLMAGMKLCKCTTPDREVVRILWFLKVLYRFGKLEFVKQLFFLFQRGNDCRPHYNNCKNWTELRPIHYFGSKCRAKIS